LGYGNADEIFQCRNDTAHRNALRLRHVPIPGTVETATSLNGFRASHGLSQLRTDGTLAALASEHAADMARVRASTTTAS